MVLKHYGPLRDLLSPASFIGSDRMLLVLVDSVRSHCTAFIEAMAATRIIVPVIVELLILYSLHTNDQTRLNQTIIWH